MDTTLHGYLDTLFTAADRSRNKIDKEVVRAGHRWIDGPLVLAGRLNLVPRLKQLATPSDVTRLLNALFTIEHMGAYLTTRSILYTSLFINLAVDCSGRIGEYVESGAQRSPKYLRWNQIKFYIFSDSYNSEESNTILAKIHWKDLKGVKGSEIKRSKTIPL